MYSSKLLNAYTEMSKLLQHAPKMTVTPQIPAPPRRLENPTQIEKPKKNPSTKIPAQPPRAEINNQHKIRKIKEYHKQTLHNEPASYYNVSKCVKPLIKINAPTIVNSTKPPSSNTTTSTTLTTYAPSLPPLNISRRTPKNKEKSIN